jgi:hypothetical protein
MVNERTAERAIRYGRNFLIAAKLPSRLRAARLTERGVGLANHAVNACRYDEHLSARAGASTEREHTIAIAGDGNSRLVPVPINGC